MKTAFVTLLLLGAAAGVCRMAGCGPAFPPDGRDRPVRLILAFDRSGSYRSCLPGALEAACDLSERLDPDRDRLTCFAIDTEVTALYDDKPQEAADAQAEILDKHLARMPLARGTRPSLFLEPGPEGVRRRNRTPSRWPSLPTATWMRPTPGLGSCRGPETGPLPQHRVCRYLRRCSGNRLRLETAFQDFPHDRFRLYGTGESDTDALFARLKEAASTHKESTP